MALFLTQELNIFYSEPLLVIEIEEKKCNKIIVCPSSELKKDILHLKNINWLYKNAISHGMTIEVS